MSLLDIELKANWLNHQLQRPISTRLKLQSICNFFSDFINEEDQSKYLSYHVQFKDSIIHLLLKNQFEYFTPDEIETLKSICNKSFSSTDIKEEKNKQSITGLLDKAKENINSILNGQTNDKEYGSDSFSINQVLVETGVPTNLYSGIIEKLSIETKRNDLKEVKNKISFEGIVANNDDEISNELDKILNLVGNDVNKVVKNKMPNKFSLAFEKKEYEYRGISMGTGAAALIYNSVLRSSLHKTYYKFRNNTVLGSAIDKNGYLIPVDQESLIVKLRTVFYSPYKKFVLPEENIIDARNELEKLTHKYPNRNLELVPIRHYLQIFKNLDIVEICKLKAREKVKANYNRYHVFANTIFSLVVFIMLGIITVNFVIPHLDHNPIYTKLQNNRYAAFNKYGKEVWSSKLLTSDDIAANNNGYQRIAISDLDGDGKNEIICIMTDEKNHSLCNIITCYNDDNSIKWQKIIIPVDSLYGADICYNRVNLHDVFVRENPESKLKELIVDYSVCELYPSFITKLDSHGKEISSFYNSGCGYFVRLMDLDNSGKDELIFAGTNNDYNKSACLIIFDPQLISGRGPGYRYPRSFKMGLMKYYILFPKMALNKFSSQRISWVSNVTKSINTIEAVVNESGDYTELQLMYRVLYDFDSHFNFLHLQTSNEFDERYKELIEQGKIKPIKDWKAYEDSLRKEIMFWDGDKFVNYPTMNKYYLEAIKQKVAKTNPQ